MFRYWGFGLNILSQLEFPELLPKEFETADVTIELGTIPLKLDGDDIAERPFSSVGEKEYILNIKNVCKYYAGYGTKIIAEPEYGIDEKSIRLFLLGTIMAAILYQRGSLPLHAAAVIKNDKLIIFAGKSGAGKSTLTALLASKGYDIFTDDICVMHSGPAGKQGVYCTASYPMIKLWDDAINHLESSEYSRDYKIRPELPKYGQFFFENFSSNQLPIDKIFIIHPAGRSEKITVTKLTALESFKQLELQAYKNQLILSKKLRMVHFGLLSAITKEVPVFEIYRPAMGTNTKQLYEAIKNLL